MASETAETVSRPGAPPHTILRTLTRVVNTLRENGIRFAVAGGCAVYARGGPASEHDLDVFVRESDVSLAVTALADQGMEPADPPEDWLVKVYDGDVMVDLIFRPNQREVTERLLHDAEPMRIGSAHAPVLTGTDLLTDKVLVLEEHRCDLTPLLAIARALREQVDWDAVSARTVHSPYARAFLGLLRDLSVA